MKSKLFIPLFMTFCTALSNAAVAKEAPLNQAVSFELSGGRFGDCLLSYMHAKWVSYKYNLPLILSSFPYSDQLVLGGIEYPESVLIHSKFNKTIDLNNTVKVLPELQGSVLYHVPYFPETQYEHTLHSWPYIPVDWSDPKFKALLKEAIRPTSSLSLLEIPKDMLTVAVHIRTGGGYDDHDHFLKEPLRMPPLQFYAEQIQRICILYPEKELYVHIFTDERKPDLLVQKLLAFFKNPTFTINYRSKGNRHNMNVLEDFFSMTLFDCLIRPQSNYSITAEKIADYKVVISPSHFIMKNDLPVIDEVSIIIRS